MKKQILLDNLEQLETKEYTKLTPILVPENWAELKFLCKDVKDIQIVSNVIYLEPEDLGRIELYIDGVIVCNEYVLAEDRTAAQMWKFILSLTEKNK